VVIIGTGQTCCPVLAWGWRDWRKCEMPQNCRAPDRDRRCWIASGASNVALWSLQPAGTRTHVAFRNKRHVRILKIIHSLTLKHSASFQTLTPQDFVTFSQTFPVYEFSFLETWNAKCFKFAFVQIAHNLTNRLTRFSLKFI